MKGTKDMKGIRRGDRRASGCRAFVLFMSFMVSLGLPACTHTPPATSWSDLGGRLTPGTSVAVIDRNGGETRGRVAAVSPASVTIRSGDATRDVARPEVVEIRRNGDPLWNGIAIGGAVGVLGAMLPDARYGGTPRRVVDREIPQRIAFAGAATALGAAIDALHRD